MYKIEVICGHCGGTPEKPYFWSVLKWSKPLITNGVYEEKDTWANDGFGWAETIEEAFVEAKKAYDKKIEKGK